MPPPGKAVPTMARWRTTAHRRSYLSSLTDFVRNPRNPRNRGRRRMVAALAATAVVIGLGTTWAGSALATSPVSAAVTPAATTTGAVTGYQGLCLDDRSASTTNSNPIQVDTCNGSAAQSWTSNGTTLQVLCKR